MVVNKHYQKRERPSFYSFYSFFSTASPFGFLDVACEYKKVPKIAMAEPRAFNGLTGFLKTNTVETITTTLFIVLPTENVRGLMSSKA